LHGRRNILLILRVQLSLQTSITTEIKTEMTEIEIIKIVKASAATELISEALDLRDITIFIRRRIAIHESTHIKNVKRQKTATRTNSISILRDDSATALRNNSSSISLIARERKKTRKMLIISLKLLL
jgi:hypothetical protein